MKTRLFKTKRNDLTIRGKVFCKDFTKRNPVFILSHGFLQNYKACKNYALHLAKSGYAAFVFDFCGGGLSNKSDGSTTQMSVLTEKEDLKAVIEFAKRQNYAESENVSLLGCSQGGFVSAMVANDLKDEIKNLVLLYPAFCIPDDARKGNMIFARFDPTNIPEIIPCGPIKIGKCYPEAVINMNPYKEIENYKGRVLLIHGTEDFVVNISYAQKAKEVYTDFCYCELEGAPHSFKGVYQEKAKKVITVFLK